MSYVQPTSAGANGKHKRAYSSPYIQPFTQAYPRFIPSNSPPSTSNSSSSASVNQSTIPIHPQQYPQQYPYYIFNPYISNVPNVPSFQQYTTTAPDSQDDLLISPCILNILNLPSFHTTPSSINSILLDILEVESPPISNLKIYKSTGQHLCWSSFTLDDPSLTERLITNLNGYSFCDSTLKCFIQPPTPKFQNTVSTTPSSPTSSPILTVSPINNTIPQEHQQQQQKSPQLYHQPPPPHHPFYPIYYSMPYPPYQGTQSHHQNSQMYHNSYQNQHQQHPRSASFSQRQGKPLGNNYSSIVYPDLSDPSELIDDNDLPTSELVQFNPARHVSPTRIFIGNIPFQSSYHSLWFYLTNGGEEILLEELQLKIGQNGLSKGFAVGVTRNEENSIKLIERFNAREFEGRKLIVRFDKLGGLVFRSHLKKKLVHQVS